MLISKNIFNPNFAHVSITSYKDADEVEPAKFEGGGTLALQLDDVRGPAFRENIDRYVRIVFASVEETPD